MKKKNLCLSVDQEVAYKNLKKGKDQLVIHNSGCGRLQKCGSLTTDFNYAVSQCWLSLELLLQERSQVELLLYIYAYITINFLIKALMCFLSSVHGIT